jgi:hypothetical protein
MVLVALVAILTLAAPGSSSAAGGVHFDPESPAGKEYALPLDEARNEAAGTGNEGPEGSSGSRSGSKVESGESAPLFGEGVSGGGSRSGATSGAGRSGAPQEGGTKPSGGGAQSPGSTGAQGRQIPEGDGGYPVPAGIGLAALIVLIGVGAGLGLRGLRRVRPT